MISGSDGIRDDTDTKIVQKEVIGLKQIYYLPLT